MIRNLEKHKNYKIYANSLFSSLDLVKVLKSDGFFYTGTVRINRLKGIELKTEKQLRKDHRGATDSQIEVDSNIVVTRWFDNKKVDMIISYLFSIEPITNVSRYDKKQKKEVEVPCPDAIKNYNSNMGGVDLLDCLTALYKAKIKTRRWYLYIVYHTFNMVVVTSWLQCKRHCKQLKENKHLNLKDFQLQVAETLIKIEKPKGRPSLTGIQLTPAPTKKAQAERAPPVDVRLDNVGHFPLWGKRTYCKVTNCNQKSYIICSKCQVHLCLNKYRNCFFLNFHM